jgi:excisionase family DNA binding protein
MLTLTHPASTPLPRQLSERLHFALENVARSLVTPLTAAIAARAQQPMNSKAIRHVVSDVLPGFLEKEFTQGLLRNEKAARERRAMLMHVLSTADVRAFMENLAETPAVDEDEQLTSQAAAKLLHVSRTHLNTLLDAGKLGEVSRTAGGHRRISKAAVLAYKAASKARQAEGLASMARASQRLGLYKDELAGVPRRAKR